MSNANWTDKQEKQLNELLNLKRAAFLKPGARVRITAAEHTYGDYENGDTATVVGADTDGVTVDWDVKRHHDQARCKYVFFRELELIP